MNQAVFQYLCNQWGTPLVDFFATKHNIKCTGYCSRAGLVNLSLGDAFMTT